MTVQLEKLKVSRVSEAEKTQPNIQSSWPRSRLFQYSLSPPSPPHSRAAWPAAPAGQVSVLHQSVQTESPSVLELLKSKETRSLSTQTGIQARLALNVQFLESIPVLYPDTYFEKEEQLRGYEMSPWWESIVCGAGRWGGSIGGDGSCQLPTSAGQTFRWWSSTLHCRMYNQEGIDIYHLYVSGY